VKRFALALVAAAAVFGGAAHAASAQCGLPDQGPMWVDFAGHDAPITVKPGMVLAVASGTDVPAQFRSEGAATVLFDLNFNKRVGTTTAPADPSVIDQRAQSLFQYAQQVTGCSTPVIAENELSGAQTPTPWTANNAQYRANVLEFLTDLTSMGATPLLSIPNPPYTGGDATYWWQQVSKVAILLRQVYFTSPNIPALYKLGPTEASLDMRQSLRGLVDHLTQIGIPSSRVALEMQLTTSPGLGQRGGLEPSTAWFEMVKLEALAAQAVATQFKLPAVWSWGWATFGSTPPDPDVGAAVCVWQWTYNQSLCDGPTAAGAGFDSSLTEGQVSVPAADRCVTSAGPILRNAVARYTALTGDPGYAASVLLEQLTLASQVTVDPADVLSAERAAITASFGGDRADYQAAVARTKLTLGDARAIIAARLEQDEVETTFKVPAPSPSSIQDFIASYQDEPVRLVTTSEAAPWLGGSRGYAIATLAPDEVFTLTSPGKIDTADGTFDVTSLGTALPLGLLPHPAAVSAARAALVRLARDAIYRGWLRGEEQQLLTTIQCQGDQAPTPEQTDLSPFLPFLFST
jgi:hypothetical protein